MIVHDHSNVPQFLKMLDELSNTHLEIGVFSEAGGKILMIAGVHEYGISIEVTDAMRGYLSAVLDIYLKKSTTHINIPERSFIRAGFDQNKSKIIKSGEGLLERVINLELSVDAFFDALGESIVGMIQEYMTDLRDPGLHPKTIEQKKSSNPLVDTGQLRDSITHKVVRN